MRRSIVPVLCAALLLPLGGCDGADPTAPDAAVDAVGGGNDVRPQCPFTAAQVSEIIGQPMTDQGNCLFGDGKGVASLTVTTASQTAGAVTYDYQRQQAPKIYREVKDIDKGEKAYLAVKDIEAEAVVVSAAGSYTLILSSFERLSADPGAYERTLRTLLDTLPL
ncbi:hypothetical protein [Micromonospora sp. NPDC092111]|uniref:hypothetical protein n=1 Tax=Micromonospora sp. NPDC092111 TaxID=3364289 RepID=UPI0037FB0260